MRDIYDNHERLLAVLDDSVDDGESVFLEDGVAFVRQATDDALYGLWIDGDIVTIFRAECAKSTVQLAREARITAREKRNKTTETEEEPIDLDTAAFH